MKRAPGPYRAGRGLRRVGGGLVAVVFVLIVAVLAGTGAGAVADTDRHVGDGQTWARADRDLLARILDETGVQRTLPEPSWTEYLGEVFGRLVTWLLGPLNRLVSSRALWPQMVAWIALAVLASILLLFIARWLLQSRRRRSVQGPSSVTTLPSEAADLARVASDRATWRAEIDRRLAAGRVEAALEAVWWWLARSLLAQAVDPSWTSRELIAAAERRELTPLTGVLDRMLYGPTRPSVPDVRGLVTRIEGALA